MKQLVDPHQVGPVPKSASRKFVVEALEGRTLLDATIIRPIGNQTFAQDSGQEQAYLYGVFADTNGLQDLTFAATSSNPAVLTASVSGNVLSITPVAGQSGFARVQMLANDTFGNRVSNTFRVQITAADTRSLDVLLGAGSPSSIRYTQSNGTSATVSLSGPGSAVLHFGGDNLTRAGTVLNGSNEELESVTLSDTTRATTLSISGNKVGGLLPSVGHINASGSLGHLKINNAVLDGDVNVAGELPDINVDFAEGGTLTVGSGAVSITGGTFVDENFASTSPVNSVKVDQWSNSDDVSESFTGTFVRKVSVKGNFTPGLQLSGAGAPGRTLGAFKVPGAIGGTWNVTGGCVPLKVGGTQKEFDGTFAALPSFTSTGDFNGTLTAPTVKTISVRGIFFRATINLTAPGVVDVQSITAKQMVLTHVITAGSVGSVSAPYINGLYVYAGVSSGVPDGLPATPDDFTAQASVKSVFVRGGVYSPSSRNFVIAAWSVGSVQLDTIKGDNTGVTFGVAGHTISKLSLRSQGRALNLSKVQDQGTADAQVAAQQVNLGDMVVRVV